MAHVGRRGPLSSFLLTFMSTTSYLDDAIGTQTWTVGDSFGWNRSPPFSYDQWAAGKTIQLDDHALLFSFNVGQHNVLKVTKSNLASCVTSDPISSRTGDSIIIQLASAGYRGFISGLPGDCTNRMHLSLQVFPSSGLGGTPPSSPVSAPTGKRVAPPHPASSPTPAGGLSNSGLAPVLSQSSAPSTIPPGSHPLVRPPADSPPVGTPPAGYAPGAAPNIPGGSTFVSHPKLSPGFHGDCSWQSIGIYISKTFPAGGDVAPFSGPSKSPGFSPSPTPITGISPLSE